jgi:hypothetical protein
MERKADPFLAENDLVLLHHYRHSDEERKNSTTEYPIIFERRKHRVKQKQRKGHTEQPEEVSYPLRGGFVFYDVVLLFHFEPSCQKK